MVVYFHNRHGEPLLGLLHRLLADGALTQDETEAAREASRNIEIETTHAPYRLWLRDKKTTEGEAK